MWAVENTYTEFLESLGFERHKEMGELYYEKSAEWETRIGLGPRPLAEVGWGMLNDCFPLPQSFFLVIHIKVELRLFIAH